MELERVVAYLREATKQGKDLDYLKKELLNQGWSQEEINRAVARMNPNHSPGMQKPYTATPVGRLGLMSKFVLSLKSPATLFNYVKGEHDLNEALKLYTLMMLYINLIAYLMSMVSVSFSNYASMFGLSSILSGSFFGFYGSMFLIGFIYSVVMSFSVAGFFHIFAMLFKAEKKGFAQTYKSFFYASPVLTAGTLLILVVLLVSPQQTIVGTITGIAVLVWYLAVSALGLSILHEISKQKASIVIIVPILMVLVFLLMTSMIMGSMLGGFGTFPLI